MSDFWAAAAFALAYVVLFVAFLAFVIACSEASKGREDEWR